MAAVKPFEVAYGSVSGTLYGVRDARGKTVRVTGSDQGLVHRRSHALDRRRSLPVT